MFTFTVWYFTFDFTSSSVLRIFRAGKMYLKGSWKWSTTNTTNCGPTLGKHYLTHSASSLKILLSAPCVLPWLNLKGWWPTIAFTAEGRTWEAGNATCSTQGNIWCVFSFLIWEHFSGTSKTSLVGTSVPKLWVTSLIGPKKISWASWNPGWKIQLEAISSRYSLKIQLLRNVLQDYGAIHYLWLKVFSKSRSRSSAPSCPIQSYITAKF